MCRGHMAKLDKTRHQEELSIQQWTAIDLLVIGKTHQETAEAVGRSRQTVCDWRSHHPAFRAEVNKRRQEVWAAAADQSRSLVPKAVAVLERELDGGDHCFKAALEVVKMAGLPLHSIGPEEEEEIVAEAAEAQSRKMFAHLRLDLTAARKELLVKANAHDRDS
jgi:Homeodomain-like domain-containing protein